MHLSRRLCGLAVATVTAAAPLAVLPAGPAAAAGPQDTITVALAPASSPGLARLAAHPPRTRAQRLAALAGVRPSAAEAARVTGWLSAQGLTVRGGDGWSVTARGPAAAAERASAEVTQALPQDAQAVVGLSHRAVWHRDGTEQGYDAAQIRAAYQESGIPANAGAGITVASVQYSGWSQLAGTGGGGDLVSFAQANGLPVPSLTAVSVNGAPVTQPDQPGDDFEVAMDQEALTTVAPGAAQRVYVTTNDVAGGVLVWQRIADDVAAGSPVSVVTTSWGDCEQDLGLPVVQAMETQIERLSAMGVTVFAASGDGSAWDCPPGTPWAGLPTVDYPASSPFVVSVGGTSLHQDATGGFTQTAWGPSELAGAPSDGSGGGVSSIFPRPAWQQQVPGLPAGRLVPDIAAVADPADGFSVYWNDGSGGGWWDGGGTSLATPLEAGMFTTALAAAGDTSGVGDIHALLYGHPADFSDVTTGSNGVYLAGTGYDPVTGLGSPEWSALQPLLNAPAAVATSLSPTTAQLAVSVPTRLATSGYAAGPGVSGCSALTAGSPPSTLTVSMPAGTTSLGLAVQTAQGCELTTVAVPVAAGAPTASATLARLAAGSLRLGWGGAPADATYRLELDRDGSPWLTTYAFDPGTVTATVPPGGQWQLQVTGYDAVGDASATASSAPVDLLVPVVASTGVHGPAYRWAGGRWVSLDAVLAGPPAVTGWNGNLYFVGVNRARQLIIRTATSGWQLAAPAGTFCWHGGAAVVGSTLYLTCETRSQAAAVGWTTLTGSGVPQVTAWHTLDALPGGGILGAPVTALVGGTTTFFATAAAAPHQLYFRSLGVAGWHPMAQTCQAGPAAAFDDSQAYAGCVNPHGVFYVQTYTASGWLPPQGLASHVTGAPGLAMNAGALTVAAETTTGSVISGALTGGWVSLGGAVTGGVGAGSL